MALTLPVEASEFSTYVLSKVSCVNHTVRVSMVNIQHQVLLRSVGPNPNPFVVIRQLMRLGRVRFGEGGMGKRVRSGSVV